MQNSDGSFVKYLNGQGIDDKLKLTDGVTAKYFLQDQLGSTTALTDATGNIISSASYDSFGNSTNSLGTRYQFTGREKDEFSGLTYYRARWYSSELGRFVSEDPIGFEGGDVNLFGYVGNNPLNFIDPFGLQDGPVNYLRNPLDPEHWIINGLSNTASDLLGLDDIAEWSWTVGDFRCSTEEKIWAGTKLGGTVLANAFGGAVVGRYGSKLFKWAKYGEELKHGKNFRAAPFGNRTGNQYGKYPHYHRRETLPNGTTKPGQGIGRHRPWESKSTDNSFWDRF